MRQSLLVILGIVCSPALRSVAGQPYPDSPVIAGLVWADASTILRLARGADNWPLTWADDDKLYGAGGDSHGAFQTNTSKYSLIVSRIAGHPPDIVGHDVNLLTRGQGRKGKKGSGMLCVDGRLIMWVRNADLDGHGSQLAWSDDHGVSWTWADWVWDRFGYCSFINFGKNYAGARDEYVYAISHDHPDAYVAADRFILMRVPKDRLLDQASYEFYVNRHADGATQWTHDVDSRGAIFSHEGRCRRSGISYNAGIGRYLWWQQLAVGDGDTRSAGGFGVYDAPEPWGPWTTVFFTEQWDVGPGETGNFPTKWMSADGRKVHLVFSGDDFFSVRAAKLTVSGSGD